VVHNVLGVVHVLLLLVNLVLSLEFAQNLISIRIVLQNNLLLQLQAQLLHHHPLLNAHLQLHLNHAQRLLVSMHAQNQRTVFGVADILNLIAKLEKSGLIVPIDITMILAFLAFQHYTQLQAQLIHHPPLVLLLWLFLNALASKLKQNAMVFSDLTIALGVVKKLVASQVLTLQFVLIQICGVIAPFHQV